MDRNFQEIEDQLSNLLDDRVFHDIDSRFRRFNIFEAVGAVRAELRHSNFLAYLLSPSRPHGLSTEILDRVLRALITKLPRDQRPVSVLQVLVGDLDTAVVEREKDNIDILIEIKALNLVVLIENKVGAAVTEGQLTGYKNIVHQKYPEWRKMFVLLNPDGLRPDNGLDDPDYFTFSYDELAGLLVKYVEERRTAISTEIALVIDGYVDALRRHVVEDSELRETARQLYFRYKEAFDFIFESRPAPNTLLDPIKNLIDPNILLPDPSDPMRVRFAPREWMGAKELNSCPPDRWTKSGKNLLFEVRAYKDSDRVSVGLTLGPVDESISSFRRIIYDAACKEPGIFKGLSKPMGQSWSTIYMNNLLTTRSGEGMEESDKIENIKNSWTEFEKSDLPALKAKILEIAQLYRTQSGSPSS